MYKMKLETFGLSGPPGGTMKAQGTPTFIHRRANPRHR
jgi:hypothetical protein